MIHIDVLLPLLAFLAGLAISLPAFAQYSTTMWDVDNGAGQPGNREVTSFINSGANQGNNTTSIALTAGAAPAPHAVPIVKLP